MYNISKLVCPRSTTRMSINSCLNRIYLATTTRTFITIRCRGPLVKPRRYVAQACNVRLDSLSSLKRSQLQWARAINISGFTEYLVPPAVFVGLVLALWFYKCCMMVLFQNKIIYMPSVPPFSRREKISDYATSCKPVCWRQEMIRSTDGTLIALCVGNIESTSSVPGIPERPRLVVLYFQGNAASLPPRLPVISSVLKLAGSGENPVECTVVALSYRGFWRSSGRASQPGIEKDAAAALEWAQRLRTTLGKDTRLVLWGQSIGAGVATTTVARLIGSQQEYSIDGVILETPFVSIRDMLISIYPQKWLPYRYLWPFLRSLWDNESALRSMKDARHAIRILILTAADDEVVPPDHGQRLVRLCKDLGLDHEHRQIGRALHTEVMARYAGRVALVEFLQEVAYKPNLASLDKSLLI